MRLLVFVVCLAVTAGFRDVQQVFELQSARVTACQAADGSNNWGVFHDNFALQDVLWSQDANVESLFDISVGTLLSTCAVPPLIGQFVTPLSICSQLGTQHSRDLFFSSSIPFACSNNCTPSASDACSYQLQIKDARCGSSYKVPFSQSGAWPISLRLREGESITGPGRVAVDRVASNGGSTADACSRLINDAELSGHWCVVTRGTCSLATKVTNCFGGSSSNSNRVLGVIVIDSVLGVASPSPLVEPIPFRIDVPVIMISKTDGDRLAGHVGSSIFTISKAIGPADPAPRNGVASLVSREHRTGQVFSSSLPLAANRFFAEPNRLYGWAFGMFSSADSSTNNIGLFDLSNPRTPTLLRQWKYADLGLPLEVDVSVGNLIFAQQQYRSFVWIIGNNATFRFWDVTDALQPTLLTQTLPRSGYAFINRNASLLWQQTASPLTGEVQGWRYQQAWSIANLTFPRLLGAFALDTSLLAPAGGRGSSLLALHFPTFDSWGVDTVSYNLGDNGVAFYNYSNPISVRLSAFRDLSPSSCSPDLSGAGASGAIVPSPSQPNVWIACRQYEVSPRHACGTGRLAAPNLAVCDPSLQPPTDRIDFVGLLVLPEVINKTDCEDGAIVNLFFNRK